MRCSQSQYSPGSSSPEECFLTDAGNMRSRIWCRTPCTGRPTATVAQRCLAGQHTPNLPTKIIPTKICGLKMSGKFPLDMRIPALKLKILLESNPLKSRILVRRLAINQNLSKEMYACKNSKPQGLEEIQNTTF